MGRGRRLALAGISVIAIVAAGGSVAASAGSSPGRAFPATQPAAGQGVEAKVNALLAKMTTEEKLQQLQLLSDGQVTDADAKAGRRRGVQPGRPGEDQPPAARRGGAVPAAHPDPVRLRHDPRLPDGLPDPARRGQLVRPGVAAADDTVGARETATVGIKQVYSPDGRRLARAALGPDLRGRRRGPVPRTRSSRPPGSRATRAADYAARTRSWPASSTSPPTGSPRAAVTTTPPTCPSSGCATSTCRRSRPRSTPVPTPRCARSTRSTACPGCANPTPRPRSSSSEWGFDGFIESDYTAVAELRACPPVQPDEGPCGHGVAADGPAAAALALNAGTDSEMVSTNIRDYGKQLLADGKISMARVDDAVRRILRVKFRAGLFDHPYVDVSQGREPRSCAPDDRGRRARGRGPVDGAAEERRRHAAARPDQEDRGDRPARRRPARHARPVVGPGPGRGRRQRLHRHQGAEPGHDVHPGLHAARTSSRRTTRDDDVCGSDRGFAPRSAAARKADQVVLALGETREMSGEAAARSDIDLPGQQQELIDAIKATGKPFVVVLFNGRPLTLGAVVASRAGDPRGLVPGRRGRQRGRGRRCSARSTRAASCRSRSRGVLGQVPIYYNHEPTGRPCDATQKYNSRYRDLPTCDAAVPVRLRAQLHDVRRSRTCAWTGPRSGRRRHGARARSTCTNTGKVRRRRGRAALPARPGREHLPAGPPAARVPARHAGARARRGRSRSPLDKSDFGFYDNSGKFVVEPGEIDVYAGDSRRPPTMTKSFTVR